MAKLTPEQNQGIIKVHQLLVIAKDIAKDVDLPWLGAALAGMDAEVRKFHEDGNK